MQKVCNTGSGHDPPSVVWIHLTVCPKFGFSLTFCSGVLVCLSLNSKTAMFTKHYMLSDTVPCCFSEATLSEFSATLGSPETLPLHARFLLSLLPQALRDAHWKLTRSHPLYSDSEFLCIFSVDTSDIFLGLWCGYQWNVWALSSTLVVFVHCVVLKIELLFLMSFTKCDAST